MTGEHDACRYALALAKRLAYTSHVLLPPRLRAFNLFYDDNGDHAGYEILSALDIDPLIEGPTVHGHCPSDALANYITALLPADAILPVPLPPVSAVIDFWLELSA